MRLRHILVILFFFFAWSFLKDWYVYQNWRSYYFFAAFFCGAILLAGFSRLLSLFQQVTRARLCILSVILVLALPWAEWLRLGAPNSREDWSRQILTQSIFLYLSISFLDLFPRVTNTIERTILRISGRFESKKYFLWVLCILFFSICSWIAIFLYGETPLTSGTASHLFQAKIFLQKKLYASAPPLPDFFSYPQAELAMKDGRWFGKYTPGLAAVLAPALRAGVEWMVCPLLAAFTLLIWISYARRWHGNGVALLLGCLMILSPFVLVLSSSITVHTPELFITSAVIYVCRLKTESSSRWHSLAVFLLLFLGVLVRPFSLLVFLFPVLLYTSYVDLRSRRYDLPAAAFAAIFLGGITLGFFQWKTTGDPLTPAYNLTYSHPITYGFGESILGLYTPARALENISNHFLSMNKWLTGWYCGSLFLLAVFFLTQPKFDAWDRVLQVSCALLILFYFFYFFQGLVYGPRFYYPFAPFLLLMIARASLTSPISRTVLALVTLNLVLFLPQRLTALIQSTNPNHYQNGLLKKTVRSLDGRKTLLFLDRSVSQEFLSWNDPFLKSPVILCRDLQIHREELITRFHEYQPLYYRPTSRFTPGKKVASGNLTALFNEPDTESPGSLSLFQFSLILESLKNEPDRDCFDTVYPTLLSRWPASDYWNQLKKKELGPSHKNTYKDFFQNGLVHTARMILLLKIAYEQEGETWTSVFSVPQFRSEYLLARTSAQKSGEVGRAIDLQLEKVARRMDQNRDHHISDAEILRYLAGKIKILEFL